MIRYKIPVLQALKEAGYTTYKIQKDHIIGSGAMQKIRTGGFPSRTELDRLCRMLNLQPGDILEYVPDDEASN